MPNYSFEETVRFFSHLLNSSPPEDDLKNNKVELKIDQFHLFINQGHIEGSLHMYLNLGLLLQPISEERLKQLVTSNFLGVNTGGCALAIDENRVTLSLHCHTTCGTSPQENWEWLHRILCVAREWNQLLIEWDEFVPLNASSQGKNEIQKPNARV